MSSWLGRTARFYGLSLVGLFAEHVGSPRPHDAISAVDLGDPPRALIPVARLLGLSVEALRSHTILGAYPWARDLVSQARMPPGSNRTPSLRYAACPHCLEQQRACRGFSWLRRDWLLAPRTVCPVHHAVLMEVLEGPPMHPVWQGFLRRHERAAGLICVSGPVTVGNANPVDAAADEAPQDPLYRLMAGVEDAIVNREKPEFVPGRGGDLDNLAVAVGDLAWAFTRNDAIYGDRIVYEAFALDALDNPWHVARRRCAGPVAFRNLYLDVRHRMLATATVLAGPRSIRERFLGPRRTWKDDVASIFRRLVPDDCAELAERQQRWVWPVASTNAHESTV